jgi:hypothetical protein
MKKVLLSAHTYCLFDTDSTCQQIVTVTYVYPRTGRITFTKVDTVNKIISDSFEVQIPIPGCDTLSATYGRFDILY